MPNFPGLRQFIRFTRRADAIRGEVEEELRLHIELRAEALERSGLSPRDARALALAEFGDLADATQYCVALDRQSERRRRASDWLSELRHDVLQALRVFWRAPAFALAAVITLGFALGVSSTVYAVLHTYLLEPLPYPESDRLMFLRSAPGAESRAPSLERVRRAAVDSLFAATASWNLDGFTIPGDAYAENVTGAWVSQGFFQTMRVQPALGRTFLAAEYRDEAAVAIISHELWVRRFGADRTVIGSTVTMHSTERPTAPASVMIVGVTAPDFWPLHWRESGVLRPMAPVEELPYLVRLETGAVRERVEQELNAMVRAQVPGTIDPLWRLTLTPALKRHSANVQTLLLSVFGAALFMLLAACGSVAGALISRSAARQSEFAIRMALGGSRARVLRQLITESAVLGIVAGAFGLLLAWLLLDASAPLIERRLGTTVPGGPAALRPDAAIVLLSALVSAVVGAALGVPPAFSFLRLGRSPELHRLSARAASARRGATRVRRVLIAGQVAVAIVLLFGAGLMFRTLARIADTDVGFRTDGVVAATLLLPASYADSAARQAVMHRLLERLQQTEGVRSAAAVFPRPFWGGGGFPVFLEGGSSDPASAPRAAVHTVSPEYFQTMEVPLRAGRVFQNTDLLGALPVVMVSERLAARIAPRGSVMGQRIRVRVPHLATWDDLDDQTWRTVVGVVGDTKKDFDSGQPESPDVYVPYAQNPRAWQSVVIRTDRAESTMFEPIKRVLGQVDRNIAVGEAASVTELAGEQISQRSALLVLLGLFAAFALGLCALALYASLSFTVVQRRSELAVRRAIGAGSSSLLRLVAGEGLASVAVGSVVGATASLLLGRFLRGQLYGISAADPATLITITLVLSGTALTACTIPCVRALRTDPALALRE